LTISEITRLLAREYGAVSKRRQLDPVSELVLTILSQNTSDHNSRRVFERLTARFGNWDAVADASVEEIAEAIKPGGLARVKAPRIKDILGLIAAQRGSLDLSFLRHLPLGEARAWLRGLPGVGPKTAACVLLFSLGRPALPVDTHIHRVARRLGLIGSGVSAERAHEILGAMVPPRRIYKFHILMIEHGRTVCKAQRPLCDRCVLLRGCPTGQSLRPHHSRSRPRGGRFDSELEDPGEVTA
jgi:endonuclease-3